MRTKIFCVTALFAFGTLGGMSASAENVGFAQCDEDYVNVRSGASTQSEVIGKLYRNGKVDILETVEDGNWYHIRSGNVDGYVSADFIVTGAQADELAETAGYTTAEVGAEVLNVRASMDSDSEIVGAVYENNEYEVVEDQGDWVKIVTGDGTYGWVSTDYVYVSTEYGSAETLEEEQARLDEAWLAYLAQQEQSVSGLTDGWEEAAAAQAAADSAAENAYAAQQQADEAYQAYVEAQAAAADAGGSTQESDAQVQDAYTAYEQAQSNADTAASAYSEAQAAADTAAEDAYASEQESSASSNSDTSSDTAAASDTTSFSGSSTGQAIANYACQFVGNPYVYGGSSLTNGADCSGFVMAVFANFGISLPHEAASQSGYGTAVDASSLQPGDLVFYGSGGISHVAIYIGNGSIVHAANAASGICYGSVNYSTPVAYRRLV